MSPYMNNAGSLYQASERVKGETFSDRQNDVLTESGRPMYYSRRQAANTWRQGGFFIAADRWSEA